MKKLTALFLSILLILGLTACGSKTTDSDSPAADSELQITDSTPESSESQTNGSGEATGTSGSTDTKENTPTTDSGTKAPTTESPGTDTSSDTSSTARPTAGKKTLVVYYSASGNTERIAKSIAEAANADTFEIEPQEVYTSEDLNWTDKNSRVSREHDDESLRDVPLKSTSVDNWADYDTVFIGYPIWWGIAAWPVDNFVKANDFTGKTVIPFCTSSSSGLGQSGKLLANIAKGGDWQDGQRFSSGASDSTVKDWVNGLNLSK